jgi:predicted glycoside hydrolase/deacetylase ChbG (UPF0249 family)
MNYRISFFLLASMITFAACAQEKQARLIVRGDDMGFSHAGNEALIRCFNEGIQRSVEVIVPSPWFPEAVKLLEKNPNIDVGIHLALSSEWESIKWRPVTNCPSLTDSDGYFYPKIYPDKDYPGKALKEHAWKLDEVEKEFRAQIEMAQRKIKNISHFSAHMGCTTMNEELISLVDKLAKEYKIDINLKEKGVESVGYKGPSVTSAEKIQSFIAMLDNLKKGKTYLFVDHPALDGPEMRAIYHIGYEDVAVDRQGVTDLFTSAIVKDAIKQKNIKIISYADLKKQLAQ